MRSRERDDGPRGCLWRAVLALAVVVILFGLLAFELDRSAREASIDVCERSDVDLVRAAGAGDVGAVQRELGRQSADVRDQNENSPLGCAIPRHRTEVIAALLAAGADPNRSSGSGTSEELPSELAFERNDVATLTALLDHGADPDRYTNERTPLLVLAIRSKDEVMVSLLLDHHANPDSQGTDVPLVVAVSAGDEAIVGSLMSHAAHPDGQPDQRPAVAAAAANQTKLYGVIVSAGANLSIPASATRTVSVGEEALTQAAGNGNLSIVNELLEVGTNPDHDPYLSPLLRSVTFKHAAVTQRLLDAGADPNLGEGDTVSLSMTLASINPPLADKIAPPGSSVATGTLLGTLPDISNGSPNMSNLPRIQIPPLAAAIAGGDAKTVQLLLERGADPGRIAADHYSPLYLAAVTCDAPSTHLLLAAGAHAEQSPTGYQPASVACPAVQELLGG